MATRTIVPFGPQHPALPEPIHLDLVLEDEKVVDAIPSLGYIHRGLERLAEKKDFHDMVFVAERICGICSFIHSLAYCTAAETMLKIEVPPRARYLRVLWSELSRVHSHLLWAGLFADVMGFESVFMHAWRVRERVVDLIEETSGGRVIFGSCKVGGVRKDVEPAGLDKLLAEVAGIEPEVRELFDGFLANASARERLVGVGVLAKEDAYALGAVGPTLRASGVAWDARRLGYAAYDQLTWEPVVETAGDSAARLMVRFRETLQSLDMIRQAVRLMPAGATDVRVTAVPDGEVFVRLEQPRGEVVHYLRGNGTKHLERFRVRTPTFANIPALIKMLPGCEMADVPVIVLSIDPCISCTER